MNNLPLEILVKIFSLLECRDLINVSDETCHNFLKVARLCREVKYEINKIENIPPSIWKDVFEIHLDFSCTKVTDVSALCHVHTLNLACTQIVDVSTLGNVHTLNFARTPVTDVSASSRVHTLYLTGTPVTDVSALVFILLMFLILKLQMFRLWGMFTY
jgi:hypothetical protein